MTMILIMVLLAIVITTAILWFTEHYSAAGFIIMIVGTIVIIFVIIYGVMVWWPSFQCEQKVAPSGNECSWDIFAGCQVKINGQWIPYEKWRVFE